MITQQLLPDAFSSSLAHIIERTQPGIVQVRRGRSGAGTGIIWSSDGRIITNDHVVTRDGTKMRVELQDGQVLDARLIDRDPHLDLAMLSIAASNLPAIPVGDSSRLRVGDLVFAIGHPWGHRGVVTAGIVSALSTTSSSSSHRGIPYIRSDVRLAPGNSGGPLIDAHGQVVGVNAMIVGGDLSLAIPGNTVSAWVQAISN